MTLINIELKEIIDRDKRERREKRSALLEKRRIKREERRDRPTKSTREREQKPQCDDIFELTDGEIEEVRKMIQGRWGSWAKNIRLDVEEFISELFAIAYSRKNYTRVRWSNRNGRETKISPKTYFYWLARSIFSHKMKKYNDKDIRKHTMYIEDTRQSYSNANINNVSYEEIITYLGNESHAHEDTHPSPEDEMIKFDEDREKRIKTIEILSYVLCIDSSDVELILEGFNPQKVITKAKYGNNAPYIRKKIASAQI